MINVLPPELRRELSFSVRNVRLLRYLLLSIFLSAVLSGLVVAEQWYAARRITELETILKTSQNNRSEYKDTETKVTALQSNLGLIERLFNEKTRYSALLDDLASVLPNGSYISELTLLGDEKKPLEMLILTDSFDRAAAVRNALIASARIKSADIQSITKDEDSNLFSVVIIAAFEPGQAR